MGEEEEPWSMGRPQPTLFKTRNRLPQYLLRGCLGASHRACTHMCSQHTTARKGTYSAVTQYNESNCISCRCIGEPVRVSLLCMLTWGHTQWLSRIVLTFAPTLAPASGLSGIKGLVFPMNIVANLDTGTHICVTWTIMCIVHYKAQKEKENRTKKERNTTRYKSLRYLYVTHETVYLHLLARRGWLTSWVMNSTWSGVTL